MKVLDRINIRKIFVSHFKTLYDYGRFQLTGKKVMSWNDRFLFIISPILIAFILFMAGIRITENYINILITSLSIFVGLLFSLLTLIFDVAKKEKELKEQLGNNYKNEYKYLLTKELFINISFSIAISIIAIFFLLGTQFNIACLLIRIKKYHICDYIKTGYFSITTIISFVLIIEFMLTLLMILKRFFLIYLDQFEERKL